MALSIDRLFAYVATDDDGEGVAAYQIDGQWMPLVGADEERMRSLKPVAQLVADQSGKRLALVRFEARTDEDYIEPRQSPRPWTP
jgi:hypothetical protein